MRVWAVPALAPLYALRAAGRVGEPLAHDGAVYALLVLPPAEPASASDAAASGSAAASASARSSHRPAAAVPRLFTAAADGLIKAWDLRTYDQLATLAGHHSFVCALQASGDRLYSASSDKTLAVWCLATYERLRVLTGHRGGLYSLALVRGGRACISGSLDGTMRVWPADGAS